MWNDIYVLKKALLECIGIAKAHLSCKGFDLSKLGATKNI